MLLITCFLQLLVIVTQYIFKVVTLPTVTTVYLLLLYVQMQCVALCLVYVCMLLTSCKKHISLWDNTSKSKDYHKIIM